MRLFQKVPLLFVLGTALLFSVQAASPKHPAPAPSPVSPRFSVEFRSSPDGATVEYRMTGRWTDWLFGSKPKNVGTNEPQSIPLKNGTTLTSIFRLGGYKDCRVESSVIVDRGGQRLETRHVEFDQKNQRVVTPGPTIPLDSADSRRPAIIRCDLRR